MNDRDILIAVRAEVERRVKLNRFLLSKLREAKSMDARFQSVLLGNNLSILHYIDSMAEIAFSEGLDFQTFAKEMNSVFNLPSDVTKNTEEEPLNWEYAIACHFADWQKQQMMKNCAVGYVIARNKNCLHPLRIYDNIPKRYACDDGREFWMGNDIRLPDTLFPEITWEDEPKKVKLIIIMEE